VLSLIQTGKEGVEAMLAADQLLIEKNAQRCFTGFEEPAISFAPTYKMLRGSSSEYDAQRIPAWCDRVLVKTLPQLPVRFLAYNACPEMLSSDHLPVYAVFQMAIHLHNVPHSHASPCFICISGLHATDVRPRHGGSKAECYVSFYAPFINGVMSTAVAARSLNPRWEDEMVPTLRPFSVNREYLEAGHLLCALKDALAGDLGQTAVSLKGAFGDNPVEFVAPVTRKGKPAGVLRGRVHIVGQAL
jgi:hypothetical protein